MACSHRRKRTYNSQFSTVRFSRGDEDSGRKVTGGRKRIKILSRQIPLRRAVPCRIRCERTFMSRSLLDQGVLGLLALLIASGGEAAGPPYFSAIYSSGPSVRLVSPPAAATRGMLLSLQHYTNV